MRTLIVTVAAATIAILAPLSAKAGIPKELAEEARHLAANGGVLGTAHGAATPRMRWLIQQLVRHRFKPAGRGAVATALCVVRGESGFNPGAISHTGDYGVFQINRATWYGTYDWPRILDPVYNVNVGWAMSKHGTYWYPWVVWANGTCH